MKNRKRNRLMDYDYSRDNLYFVTICVRNMSCCLGEVREMGLDDNVGTGRDLSEILPRGEDSNSIHGNKKMILNSYGMIVQNQIVWLEKQYPYLQVHNHVVMPNHVHAIIEIDSIKVDDSELKIKSLSSLVGAFKTTSSKMIHEAGFNDFAWHRSFHDHIIRKNSSYEKIMNYMDSNPQKWDRDKFFNKD